MRNLLSASMFRLMRNKLLYVGIAVNILIVIYTMIHGYHYTQNSAFTYKLEELFFLFPMINLISSGVFCGLFLSSEYSDGVLRNKLMVGRTRSQVYLANLVTSGIYGVLICLAAIVTGLCAGVPLLGWFQEAELSQVLLYALFALVNTWVCIALFTLISMLIANRGIAVAVCVVLAFGLLFFGQYLMTSLSQPEFTQSIALVNGEYQISDSAVPNPSYISGFTRQVYQFLLEFTPGGQCFLISNMSAEPPWHLPVYSGILILLATGLGLALFQKKDIK